MIRNVLFIVFVVSSCSSSAKDVSNILTCEWAEKEQCGPIIGCKPIAISTFAKIDVRGRIYERCDRKGCASHIANINSGGPRFMNVDVTGSGMFVKIGPDGLATEVVSIGNTVLVSQGICK
jgi:hypothetical protein